MKAIHTSADLRNEKRKLTLREQDQVENLRANWAQLKDSVVGKKRPFAGGISEFIGTEMMCILLSKAVKWLKR